MNSFENGQRFTPETLQEGKGAIIVLTGPSASGKSSIQEELLNRLPHAHRLITYTTRASRDEERDGVDYHFVSSDEFTRMREDGELLEEVTYNNAYYGTAKRSLEPVLHGQDIVWTMDLLGAATVDERIQEAFDKQTAIAINSRLIKVAIGVTSLVTLKDRYIERGGNRDNIRARLRRDWTVWQQQKDKFPNVVINDTGKMDSTLEQVLSLYYQHPSFSS
jgi:guanylate kinase